MEMMCNHHLSARDAFVSGQDWNILNKFVDPNLNSVVMYHHTRTKLQYRQVSNISRTLVGN